MMSYISKANQLLSTVQAPHYITIVNIKEYVGGTDTVSEANYTLEGQSSPLVCTTISIHNYVSFYLNLAGQLKYIQHVKKEVLIEDSLFLLPLMGKLRGHISIDQCLISVSNRTIPGLKSIWWIHKQMDVTTLKDYLGGLFLAIEHGNLDIPSDCDTIFRKYLQKAQNKKI